MNESSEFREDYDCMLRRKLGLIVVGIAAVFLMLVLDVSLGERHIGFAESMKCVIYGIIGVERTPGTEEWMDYYVIWESRMPRVLGGIVAGTGLAVCGAAMQSMLKNPLVDPFITGISSSAVLGVIIAISIGLTTYGVAQYGVISLAFLCALIPMSLVVMFSRSGRASPATIILIGVAVSSIFGSMSTIIMVGLDESSLSQAMLWQIGTLTKITWNSLPIMTAFTVLGTIFLVFTSDRLNILTLGDRSAKSLGLDADNYRTMSMVVVSLMCAAIICFTGIIGFLGLVIPHMVRLFIGSDNRFLIPVSAVMGAAFMVMCDCISKMLGLTGIPVGAVLSALGGPMFLILILKSRKGVLKNDSV